MYELKLDQNFLGLILDITDLFQNGLYMLHQNAPQMCGTTHVAEKSLPVFQPSM